MKQFLSTLAMILMAGNALAFNMISADEVKTKLENHAPMALVDIQVAEDFANHHLPGAIATHAYPVKSEQDKAKVSTVVADLTNSQTPVIIICPRGKGGAERAYDYLKANGIDEDRLFILENGQAGWPYAELVIGN